MSAAGRVQTSMLSVYDGQRCVGFVMNRGRQGFEAIGKDEQSLGHFDNKQEAIVRVLNEGVS
jgi:hypothetical protein